MMVGACTRCAVVQTWSHWLHHRIPQVDTNSHTAAVLRNPADIKANISFIQYQQKAIKAKNIKINLHALLSLNMWQRSSDTSFLYYLIKYTCSLPITGFSKICTSAGVRNVCLTTLTPQYPSFRWKSSPRGQKSSRPMTRHRKRKLLYVQPCGNRKQPTKKEMTSRTVSSTTMTLDQTCLTRSPHIQSTSSLGWWPCACQQIDLKVCVRWTRVLRHRVEWEDEVYIQVIIVKPRSTELKWGRACSKQFYFVEQF